MPQSVSASMRTRQSVLDLNEGRLPSPMSREELVKLATHLIMEKALEAENRDALGRGNYEHGVEPGRSYRNGVRPGRSRTAISELGERLWADHQEFAGREHSAYDIVYLVVDGIAERIRPASGASRCWGAWGLTASGSKALLHLMAGPGRTPGR